jgi:RNA-directed DNA polymerase
MVNWVLLAPTRWKLRQAIKTVNRTMAELKVEKHPDKTFICHIECGFDFLGYRFSPRGLSIASQTFQRYKVRLARLYGQGADELCLGLYTHLWWYCAPPGGAGPTPACRSVTRVGCRRALMPQRS